MATLHDIEVYIEFCMEEAVHDQSRLTHLNPLKKLGSSFMICFKKVMCGGLWKVLKQYK